jgi:hypothetical protein
MGAPRRPTDGKALDPEETNASTDRTTLAAMKTSDYGDPATVVLALS